MDISVIVVTYNQESTIARTLESILAQDFSGEYEIVIGDDCSSDGTEKICREYAARYPDRICYLRRDKNLGVAVNYFDCMDRARGRYIADCAGDDYWVDPHKLQREYDLMEGDPEVSMVVTDWMCEDSETGRLYRTKDNREITEPRVWRKGELILPILKQEITLHLCTSLYRREPVITLVKNDKEHLMRDDYVCEDLQVPLISSATGKIVLLPGVTLHYSVGHDSVSHRQDSGRRAKHAMSALWQTVLVGGVFIEDINVLCRNNSPRIDYIWAHLFKSHERNVRRVLRDFEGRMHWYGGVKSHIYRLVTSSEITWKAALRLRKLSPGS